MTFERIEFPRIHDLVRLLDLAAPFLTTISRYREDVAEITNYSVQARYPEEFLEPAREDALRSLQIATAIVEVIKSRIIG